MNLYERLREVVAQTEERLRLDYKIAVDIPLLPSDTCLGWGKVGNGWKLYIFRDRGTEKKPLINASIATILQASAHLDDLLKALEEARKVREADLKLAIRRFEDFAGLN